MKVGSRLTHHLPEQQVTSRHLLSEERMDEGGSSRILKEPKGPTVPPPSDNDLDAFERGGGSVHPVRLQAA